MSISERVAWALYVSEGWRSMWDNRVANRKTHSDGFLLYCKARSIVAFDRVLAGRIDAPGPAA